ncbi:ubiquitin carboxyl-terminal hydrolase 32 [Daktulosphaira vitifoliae]|uniref:ubiquitin carboxyl-terminal hydrolase 32 n=1 Tax=Daktulosphaira vitifoliae TaxID=58002 RepID=UPI0021A9BCC9|nr:ubiquitin carboxyl-terminal hydrolase 32 [Daktulosphaira vitifoliae]
MGAKDSKPSCITYEEAIKRINDSELKRLREAFKRLSPINGVISKHSFIKEVLGDGVPLSIADYIYSACGGTAKGIGFKDLVCGLVLLTLGSNEEKYKFLFNLYANENENIIIREEFQRLIQVSECIFVPEHVTTLFLEQDRVNYDEFRTWLKHHPDATSLSRWILSKPCSVSLSNELEMPTFYQTLAGVTHLEESDIIELEKCYWTLKGESSSGKLDLKTLIPLISPPMPLNVCSGLFAAFDENMDGHIDFKEMACGISAACRGPLTERQKFCFKVFDNDKDGYLSIEEISKMVDVMLFICDDNIATENRSHSNESVKELIVSDLIKRSTEQGLAIGEYLMWTVHNSLPMDFLNLIFQVCHVVFGLRPISRSEEGEIVKGWLDREERRGLAIGQLWYLISMDWWKNWNEYVSSNSKNSCELASYCSFESTSSFTKTSTFKLTSKKSQSSLENSIALDNSPVVVTGITPLDPSTGGHRRVRSISSYSSLQESPTQSPILSRKAGFSKPGPINNSCLISVPTTKVTSLTGEGGQLKRSMLLQGRDFQLVPSSLWKALVQWYRGSPALPRQVIQCTRVSDDVELELYPLTLKLLKHYNNSSNTSGSNNTISRTQTSNTGTWSGLVGGYGTAALNSTGYNYVSNLVNSMPRRYLAYTASFSKLATVKHVYNFLCIRLKLKPEDMRLWHFHDENNMVLIEDEEQTLEDLGVCDDDQIIIEIRNKDLTWPEEISSISVNSSDKCKQLPAEKGATGLNNLGNTCFMNAALQCVSNTRLLTQYFITDMHLYELNRNNPLGMKGCIAKRYGDLIHEIWRGTAKTIAPLKLRWTIGKYAPRFNGFQQHDSQELLAFLLDGLHEDLNRVHGKPYSELTDSEGRPDVTVAEEAWENHIVRNKSIVVDLFHGQLKSKVTCKECGHESVRFDPFNYLSLPLPMESYICLQAIVIKLDGTVPVKYGLRINTDDKYLVVKSKLSSLSGIPFNNLKLVEIIGAQIKNIISDEQKVKPGSLLYAYELPPPTSVGPGSEMSGDEERLSIGSTRSGTQREAAQTFTTIQRTVRPGGSNIQLNGNRTISINEETSLNENIDSVGGTHIDTDVNLEENNIVMADSGNGSTSSFSLTDSGDAIHQTPNYVIALHRKMIRQDVYFISAHKSKPNIFGLPIILPCNETTSNQDLYQAVWLQVARLVSPLPPSESTVPNHAMDCDDSLGYEFPFVLKAVNREGTMCAWCPWYRFCRGCTILCCDTDYNFSANHIAIDWDPTALHLRYQTSQESEHECVGESLSSHTEPISLESCLAAFTKEEHLSEAEKYYCSACQKHQLASKKLEIWRLPPILIVHLKRFQYLQGKWVKSHKVVKFPFKNFDPTDYLASVPKHTVLRNRELRNISDKTKDKFLTMDEEDLIYSSSTNTDFCINSNGSPTIEVEKAHRKRLESTSLIRTPIDDTALQDFHQHKLICNFNPLDLKYKLYAVVCHSGILGGGHYVSYACNPNGKWYCYNDSSCKEVTSEMDTSGAYMLFYEREGLCQDQYMPNVSGRNPVDIKDLDQDFDSDLKKVCTMM